MEQVGNVADPEGGDTQESNASRTASAYDGGGAKADGEGKTDHSDGFVVDSEEGKHVVSCVQGEGFGGVAWRIRCWVAQGRNGWTENGTECEGYRWAGQFDRVEVVVVGRCRFAHYHCAERLTYICSKASPILSIPCQRGR